MFYYWSFRIALEDGQRGGGQHGPALCGECCRQPWLGVGVCVGLLGSYGVGVVTATAGTTVPSYSQTAILKLQYASEHAEGWLHRSLGFLPRVPDQWIWVRVWETAFLWSTHGMLFTCVAFAPRTPLWKPLLQSRGVSDKPEVSNMVLRPGGEGAALEKRTIRGVHDLLVESHGSGQTSHTGVQSIRSSMVSERNCPAHVAWTWHRDSGSISLRVLVPTSLSLLKDFSLKIFVFFSASSLSSSLYHCSNEQSIMLYFLSS